MVAASESSLEAVKVCFRCQRELPYEAFNKNVSKKDGYASECRGCKHATYVRWYEKHGAAHRVNRAISQTATRERNNEYIWAYLAEHPCVDCGEGDPLWLEFDHLRDKDRAISAMVRDSSLARLKAEIAKCEVRCLKCHRLKTAQEQGWWRYLRGRSIVGDALDS